MLRRTLVALGGLLALFHGWLLGSQLWAGQLAEPGLVLRWAIAAGLVAALIGLRRSGGSMFWGRKAVCIWLLAALLHAPAMAGEQVGYESPALPEAVTAVIQIAAASVIVGLGLVLFAALARLASRPTAAPPIVRRSRAREAPPISSAPPLRAAASARPPSHSRSGSRSAIARATSRVFAAALDGARRRAPSPVAPEA